MDKSYDHFSKYIKYILKFLSLFQDKVERLLKSMLFSYKLEESFRHKILDLLPPLPLHFDQMQHINEEKDKELPIPNINSSNAKNKSSDLFQKESKWTLSNIYCIDPELLSPIPSTHTYVSSDYVFYRYVHVLSNKCMPNLYKIGYTTIDPTKRAERLYSTGVPLPFIIENFTNASTVEYLKHRCIESLKSIESIRIEIFFRYINSNCYRFAVLFAFFLYSNLIHVTAFNMYFFLYRHLL